MFVPGGWWHAVLNIEPSVAVTQNFVSPANLSRVMRCMVRGMSRFYARPAEFFEPQVVRGWRDPLGAGTADAAAAAAAADAGGVTAGSGKGGEKVGREGGLGTINIVRAGEGGMAARPPKKARVDAGGRGGGVGGVGGGAEVATAAVARPLLPCSTALEIPVTMGAAAVDGRRGRDRGGLPVSTWTSERLLGLWVRRLWTQRPELRSTIEVGWRLEDL